VHEAPDLGRRLTIAPNFRPRVPRCGHGWAIIRCEAGQVFVPYSAEWLEDFVAECVPLPQITVGVVAAVPCMRKVSMVVGKVSVPAATATKILDAKPKRLKAVLRFPLGHNSTLTRG
jgi:hypothetical protein